MTPIAWVRHRKAEWLVQVRRESVQFRIRSGQVWAENPCYPCATPVLSFYPPEYLASWLSQRPEVLLALKYFIEKINLKQSVNFSNRTIEHLLRSISNMMKSLKLRLYTHILKKGSTSIFNKGILEPLPCFLF